MLMPPVPLPAVMSPPWIMNSLTIRWKGEPLYVKGWADDGVHIARKFSPVFGVLSLKISIIILPRKSEPDWMSRNTLGRVGSEVGMVIVDMEKAEGAAVELSQSVGGIVEADTNHRTTGVADPPLGESVKRSRSCFSHIVIYLG